MVKKAGKKREFPRTLFGRKAAGELWLLANLHERHAKCKEKARIGLVLIWMPATLSQSPTILSHQTKPQLLPPRLYGYYATCLAQGGEDCQESAAISQYLTSMSVEGILFSFNFEIDVTMFACD